MQISGPYSPPMLQLRLPAQAMQGITLKPGELIQATVQQSDPTGTLTLEISGKLLQAISSLRLAAGMTLQLRVEKTVDGIVLHLDDAEQQRLMYQEALRRDLPRQESLRPLLQQLAQWQQSNTKMPAQGTTAATAQSHSHDTAGATPTNTTLPGELPKPIAQAIARLLAILPTLEKLSQPSTLQQAIAHSGLFLESQLLSGIRPTELDHDLKAVLLHLAQNIRQQLASEAVPQQRPGKEVVPQGLQNLLRQIESGIARIQLGQLNALASKSDGETHLNLALELPLYQPQSGEIEMLRIQIRRNGNKRKNGKDETWSVVLNLSPQGYGEIHAVVSLGGGKISTTFWCEEETTAQLFREHLHQLQQRLTEQGVEIAQCSSRCGKPADGFTPSANPYNGLIDTRA